MRAQSMIGFTLKGKSWLSQRCNNGLSQRYSNGFSWMKKVLLFGGQGNQ